MPVLASSLRLVPVALGMLVVAPNQPSQNTCRVLDDLFISSFVSSLEVGLLVAFTLYFVLPFLPWWWITQPYLRVVASSLGLILVGGRIPLAVLLALQWNIFLPFSLFSIDPDYLKCTMDFGAQGIWGRGTGVAMIFQLPLMSLIFLGVLVSWLIVAFLATFLLSRWGSPLGLRRYVSGKRA